MYADRWWRRRGERDVWSEEERRPCPPLLSFLPTSFEVLYCGCAMKNWLYSLSGQSKLHSKPSKPSRFPRTARSIPDANSLIPSIPPTPPRVEIPRLACSASSRADPRIPSIVRSVSFSFGCSLSIVRIADDVAFGGLVRDCQMR